MLSAASCHTDAINNLMETETMANIPEHAVVWAEIPVTDLNKAVSFYTKVLEVEPVMNTDGPQPIAIFNNKDHVTGVAGHIYEGKPAKGAGPTVHLAISGTVEDARDRVFDAGGTSEGEPVSIPAGRFVYCQDPDGNSIGLFEAS